MNVGASRGDAETLAQALEDARRLLGEAGIIRRTAPLSAGLRRFELDDVLAQTITALRTADGSPRVSAPLREGEVTRLLDVWRAAGPMEVSPQAILVAVNQILAERGGEPSIRCHNCQQRHAPETPPPARR